jgi:hypothetical protein
MASVLYYLGDMFPDKCILEDREPVATFGIPGVEGTFGLLPPKPIYWVMMILVRAAAYGHDWGGDIQHWRSFN